MKEDPLKQARLRVPNTLIILVTLVWIVAILYFIFQSGVDILSYLVIIFGLFLFGTFTLVSFYLIRNKLSFGIYAALAMVSLLLVFQQLNYHFLQVKLFHNIILMMVMFLLLLIAIFRLWGLLADAG